jgi:Ase1/PRC1/MAP65 family protein
VALESYSSHLEPGFVRLALPPTGPNQSIPPTFDLSPSYVDKLDNEFTRVYEEYTRRISTVQSLSENIIQLWAELGTPQAQTDGAIVKYYRDAPEQLGLHEEDIARLRARLDKLDSEKKNREKRLRELRDAVEALWEKLGVDDAERKAFLNANRGCGIRQINDFDDELARLNELKRQNLHLFVEDARCKLQELWDALYMCEDEMLEFTPAFSDVYSDALLEAHESEIARLEALKEQRAPVLALMERHRTLVTERDELAAASQDASRLMMKPQKGEKRDPGKLLREEKMRKRIAKELPKVTADLRKALEQWEDEWGRPFYVHGERYLDIIENDSANRATPGPRSRTPANTSMPSKSNSVTRSAPPVSRSNSAVSSNSSRSQAPSRAGAKTPTEKFNSLPTKWSKPLGPQTTINNKGSPTRIPARAPLSNLKHANYSPDKPRQETEKPDLARRGTVPVMRAPPPKMRDLVAVPETETEAPASYYQSSDRGSGVIRQIEPEDVYDDRPKHSSAEYERPISHHDFRDFPGKGSLRNHDSSPQYERFAQSYSQAPAPAIRQISSQSSDSNGTVVTGSENWETYDDASEPEEDIPIGHYPKIRSGRTNYSMDPPSAFHAGQAKRPRGIPPALQQPHVLVDGDGRRVYSGSSGWTDEDVF